MLLDVVAVNDVDEVVVGVDRVGDGRRNGDCVGTVGGNSRVVVGSPTKSMTKVEDCHKGEGLLDQKIADGEKSDGRWAVVVVKTKGEGRGSF